MSVRPLLVILAVTGLLLALPSAAWAQLDEVAGPIAGPQPGSSSSEAREAEGAPLVTPPLGSNGLMNPMQMLDQAGRALPGGDATETSGLSVAVNIMVLLTVITLVPSIMLMTTCFLRILIVLGLLKQAMGTATLPPAQVITGLALFMTLFVMSPTIERVWDEAVQPYSEGEIGDYETLWAKARQPLRDFMFDQIEATGNWSSLYMVLNYRGQDTSDPASLVRADVSTTELVPAYMLSELKVAFLMGFRVYLPFLVIDMVIASLLISMSMMMLPPVLVSLPFKLLLFVLVDGWQLVVGSLLQSFVTEGQGARLSETSVSWAPTGVWPGVPPGLMEGMEGGLPPWVLEHVTHAAVWVS